MIQETSITKILQIKLGLEEITWQKHVVCELWAQRINNMNTSD